jgi:UDP-N-acetylglucosamine--N-acetylmuramyl-(pentapeptide) pyrophosphoryl-undecaprenol N-acetylglucosamine transferase
VTPVLAVINELSRLDNNLQATFVCDRAFEVQARGLMASAAVPVSVRVVPAGKFRRYHGISPLRQLLDVPTLLRNMRDVVMIIAGFLVSFWVMVWYRPDVVFAKGGYVCLPLGFAAWLLRIPLVIHDSDTKPGLTNRLLSRFARRIATGSPLENYPYPASKSAYTGVPVDPAFRPFDQAQQRKAKAAIGVVDLTKPLVVATGGGLGAASINQALVGCSRQLLEAGFSIYHVTGRKHAEAIRAHAPEHPDYHVVDFVYQDMATVLGAADIVICRASATTLQELAALGKPVVCIPAAYLGDQQKNAQVYAKAGAALVLKDATLDSATMLKAVKGLARDAGAAKAMASRLHAFARPQAAADVAKLIQAELQR